MAIWAFFLHLANFVWPAVTVAGLLACAVLLRQGGRKGQPLQARFGRVWGGLALAGVAVLLAGLVVFNHDGKMLTYAALVLVQGTLAAWWRQRG
ncbi:MAG TPA: hypothetical protein VFY31_00430 [Macromonas sp.]|nr:hypothetical protein [Macromonas sp.]